MLPFCVLWRSKVVLEVDMVVWLFAVLTVLLAILFWHRVILFNNQTWAFEMNGKHYAIIILCSKLCFKSSNLALRTSAQFISTACILNGKLVLAMSMWENYANYPPYSTCIKALLAKFKHILFAKISDKIDWTQVSWLMQSSPYTLFFFSHGWKLMTHVECTIKAPIYVLGMGIVLVLLFKYPVVIKLEIVTILTLTKHGTTHIA